MADLKSLCIDRAKGRCESCGAFTVVFFWHHIFFRSSFAEELLETTCVICLKCHNFLHDNPEGFRIDVALKLWSQQMLADNGFTEDEIRVIVGGKFYSIEDMRGKNAQFD